MTSSLRLRLAAFAAVVVALAAAVLLGPLRPAAAADVVPGVGQAGSDRVTLDLRNITDRAPIDVTSYEASVTRPASGADGSGSGKAAFSPVVFRHAYDASSPLIARAVASGRVVPLAVFTAYENGTRKMQVTLRNVVIVGSKQYLPDTNANDALVARVPVLEEVSLSYSAIEWCSFRAGTLTPSCQSFDLARNS